MSGAPEYRYTDADVRREADLTELAKEYLEDYFGDFEPLVEAQELHLRGLVMPTPIVRKVLNCMRNDANWAHLLPRPGEGPSCEPRARLRPVPDSFMEEPDEPRERLYRIETPATVHWTYGCPRMRGNLHVVEAAHVWWYLQRDGFNRYRYSQVGQREPYLEVLWACGKTTTQPRLSLDGEDLSDFYITCCRGCFGDD